MYFFLTKQSLGVSSLGLKRVCKGSVYVHWYIFSALKTVAFDLSKEAISTHHAVEKAVVEPKKKVTPIPRQVIIPNLFSIFFCLQIYPYRYDLYYCIYLRN